MLNLILALVACSLFYATGRLWASFFNTPVDPSKGVATWWELALACLILFGPPAVGMACLVFVFRQI